MLSGSWRSISADAYAAAFARFGGSFAVHRRVVALIERLSQRKVRYAGLGVSGEIIAAVPLWGAYVVATLPALCRYRRGHLIDVGHAEVVLPIAAGARLSFPFKVDML